MPNQDASPASTEKILNGAVDRIRIFTDEGVQRTMACTRASPMKALGFAVAAGYLLRVLPLRALLGALLELTFALMRPVAFIFGAAKVCDFAVRNFTNCCARQKVLLKDET